jgi:hypothetical protein
VYVNDQHLTDDPGIHADRLSPIGKLHVKTPGWYPFRVKYFQKQFTATLKLYWKKPGQTEFGIIPPQAYGHIKK